MREQILAQLELPRRMFRNGFLPTDCPFHEHFDPNSTECRICPDHHPCQWLGAARDGLDVQSLERLTEMLQYAVEYAASTAILRGHKPVACRCELCCWTKDADTVLSRARGTNDATLL